MYKLLILAVLTTTTLTGILSAAATHPVLPPLPPRPPVTGYPANSSRGDTTMVHHQQRHHHLQTGSDDEREPVQRVVRRRGRSINIPDPDKPKVNRLLKVNRNRFLEVTWDGHVVTTTTSNSAYSKLEVQFMCQLFPEQFRPCSPWLADRPRRLPDQDQDNQDPDQDQYQDQRSTYSAVLLRFTESNRYLCIDESANIYTKPDASANRGAEPLDISECVFHHDFLPNQYDVYSSQKYPRNSSRCLRTAAAADPGRSRRPGGGGKARYCDRRWYVGVNRKAEVVTVKTSRAPSQKAFFIQRWVHDQPSQTSPQFNVNPHREAKLLGNSSNSSSSVISRSGSSNSSSTKQPEMNSSSRRPSRNRSTSSSSVSVGPSRVKPQHRPVVYRFLTRPSASLFRKRHRGKGLKGKAGCSNLLKNCDDDLEAEQQEEELEKAEERNEDERQAKLFSHRRPKRRRERKRKSRTTS